MKNGLNEKQILFEMMEKINPDFRYNTDVIEGVGDKFLSNKHIVPDEFDEFDKTYSATQNDKNGVVYQEGNWQILKNPQSLTGFGASVRGIIMDNGDLYLESHAKKIHNDILKILTEIGVFTQMPQINWGMRIPQESGFLTVQRYKNSPYIAIGESNRIIYKIDNYDKLKKYYDEYIDKAKIKMPNIEFIDKLVGSKSVVNTSGANIMNETYLK